MSALSPSGPITWTQDKAASVPLRRFVRHVGTVEVGAVAYDGSNRLWTWSSPLDIEAWGHAPTENGAKRAFESGSVAGWSVQAVSSRRAWTRNDGGV
jgi:hypothetical protein